MKRIKLTNEQKKLVEFQINEIQDLIGSEDFQLDFFESVAQQFIDSDWLSPKQMESLKRIYERVTA